MTSDNFLTKSFRSLLIVNAVIFVLVYFSFPLLVNAQIINTFSNPNPITIIDNAPASPYPSTINVTNVPIVISKVTVTLNNFSHTFPSDVDVMLVGPGGQNAMIMSDVGGGTDAVGATLTLDDTAANPIPAAIVTGTFRPTNNDTTSDVFPPPAPVPTGGAALSVFNGTNPNGTWSLYVRDDLGQDVGSFAGGWTLTITNAVSGDNPGGISIPDSGPATPYPSNINLSGLVGTVISAQVNIQGLSHSAPDDLDILLASPSGKCVMLMSDVGGNNSVSNLTITLDDSATASLPDSAALQPGTFKPTDFEAGDTFPAPVPSCTSTSATLSSLFNTTPNGSWRLFAVDDSGANSGMIANGWSLLVNTSPSAITIHESGLAEPYPSAVTVSGMSGRVSRVTVGLENFTHASPDDVDLLLVAPNGRKVVLMSDVGGSTARTNLALSFDDAAATGLPDNTPLVSGAYKPTDFEPGDIYASPAPSGPPTGRMLTTLNGSDPNGQWQLFLIDDSGNNAGTINAWTLNLQASVDVVDIPLSGTANPYPSEKTISGLPGNVTRAMLTISNFSHTGPDDVDIMLAAPNGRRIVLMSDVGGGTEVGGINLTFDDQAAFFLPDGSPLNSGNYKPTDFETGDSFPAPAPSGALTGTTLSAFYGSAPNGIWKLYVVDDSGENLGSIAASWSLNLLTSTSACLFTISPQIQAFPVTGGSGSFDITMPTGCSWTASASVGFIGITSGSAGDGNGVLSFSVAPNMGPARTGTIDVSNGVIIRTFQVQQPSGCPFSVSQSAVNFSSAGGSGNVAVTAGGVCSWQAATSSGWIHITSGQQTGNGAITFTVDPNPSANRRSGSIISGPLTIAVNQAGTSGTRFDFDGDARADLSVFRPSDGVWWINQSGSPGSYAVTPFGISTDRITPADYDGDRKADIAVYRDGVWYIFLSQTNSVRYEYWGLDTDTPMPADYDGDGTADIAVYRPSSGTWWVRRSSDGGEYAAAFGLSTDKPAAGDYDGDGRADLAVYRPGASQGASSMWAILQSGNGSTVSHQFGVGGDIPVIGDYDGDGRDNIAVFRPSSGTWYTSLDPATNYGAVQWGAAGDVPVAADYNGDGRADQAVFRQGIWYILHAGSGTMRFEQWGVSSDKPAPSAFIP